MKTRNIIGIIILIIIVAAGIVFLRDQYRVNANPSSTDDVNQGYFNTSPMPSPSPTTTNDTTNNINENSVITISDSGFQPNTLTIKAGTAVTWVNQGSNNVVVASNPHPIHTDYPPLNLGNVSPNGSVSLVFDKPGTYGYHNHLMPSQKGTIVVL